MDPKVLFEDLLKQAVHDRGHVNILIAGKTGVGKSTLINAVFQGEFAQTGHGRPVTKETREYTKSNIPLTILDTRGLENAAHDEVRAELDKLVRERSRMTDVNRHIHVAWICIQEDGRRVEDAEISLHEMLSRHMPVIGVVTKSRSDRGFRAEVQRLLPQCANVVSVRAVGETLDDGHTLAPFGLESLIKVNAEVLPEAVQRAFAAVQKVSEELKVNRARAIVAGSALTAGGVGAAPIPFADAAALVPLQVTMLTSIALVFGVEMSATTIATLVSAYVGSGGAVLAGRTLVANLLKLFPGAGSVVGGAISGATAAALTAALGEAFVRALVVAARNSSGQAPSAHSVAEAFKQELKVAV